MELDDEEVASLSSITSCDALPSKRRRSTPQLTKQRPSLESQQQQRGAVFEGVVGTEQKAGTPTKPPTEAPSQASPSPLVFAMRGVLMKPLSGVKDFFFTEI